MSKINIRVCRPDVLPLWTSVVLLILAVSLLSLYSEFQEAFADGLTQENLPPASLGDREGSLFVKISPPIFTTQTKEDAYLQFR
ncbi:MAG TPA: hypothetical protein VE130_03025, partial [Nitrososphaeraceae archaeon]|nr:hypothetical protein [Nitrososphaeraceae archaeon]